MGNCQSHEWTSGILDRRGGHTNIRFRQNVKKKQKQKQPKKSTKCWRAHPGANGLTCSKKHKLRKKIIKLEEMEPIIPGHRTYASNKCFIAKGSDNRGDNQSLQKSFVT